MHATVSPNARQKLPFPTGHTTNLKGSEAWETEISLRMKTVGSKSTTRNIALGVYMQIYFTVGLRYFSAFPSDKFRSNISMSIF